MKTQKHYPVDKLQKSSFIFTQLGLVLAMFIVHLVLEFSSVKSIEPLLNVPPVDPPAFTTDIPDIIIERTTIPEEQPKIKKVVLQIPSKVVPNTSKIIEKVLGPSDTNTPKVNIDSIIEVVTQPIDDPVDFVLLEEVPVYPGCEGLSNIESKKCFTQQVSKFVNKRFDTSLAANLNVTGEQRIFVKFKIDKTGNVVDIIANAPHKSLEKEAIRIVEKLPRMIPGKQRTKPVAVKYTLPIVFYVN